MNKCNYIPPAILKKVLLNLLAGVIFHGSGVIISRLIHDADLMILSFLILGFCLFRAFGLWQLCRKGAYKILTGTCDEISPHLLDQYMKVQVILPDNSIHTIILDRKARILLGREYTFYFRKSPEVHTGSDYIDAWFSAYNFLGFDDITAPV